MLLEHTSKVRHSPSKRSNESLQEYHCSIKSKLFQDHDFSEENDKSEIDFDEFVNRRATELVIDTLHLDEEETTKTTTQIKKIEQGYRNVTEPLSVSLSRWLNLRKNTITSLHGTELKFRLIHRTAASLTFVASTFEMVARVGSILQDMFDYDSAFPFKIIPVLGGISLTSSLMALSYSKTALEDVARDLRDEKRLHIDLETIYRKGNCIDDSVQKLFPHGIDMNLMKDAMRKQDVITTDDKGWKHLLCSVIISTNRRKDKNILEDEKFLQTLKAFVRSNAAQLWLSRIKMRRLLDEMAERGKSLEKKDLLSGNEAFLSISALNLYPAFFSLFFNNENFDKVRLVSSAVAAILTARKVAGKEKDEFRGLRRTSQTLMKEYKKIKKMNKYMLNDYE